MNVKQLVFKPGSAALGLSLIVFAGGTLLPVKHATAGSHVQREEIIVTARFEEENLQEVPIAIDVIGGDQLDRQGINDVRKLVELSPSLQFTTGFTANDPQIIIRGLRPTRGRVNAAVLLDGVDITSESIGTFGGTLLIDPELYNLERVEVVKGVQNALYGRSAFNGAVSYITKKSGDEFDADVSLDVGSDGIFRTKGRASGPLVEGVLAGGINAMYHTQDGFYTNLPTGAEVGGSEGYAIGGDLVWNISDSLEIVGRASYSDDEAEVPPWRFMNPNTQFEIPQAAIDAGLVSPGYPDADLFGAPPATIAELFNDPSLIDLIPGFVPGAAGKFPSGDQPGATMSPDPRTCSNPDDPSTCSDYEDSTREVLRFQVDVDWDLGPATLKSISHVANAEVEIFQDGNATGSAFELPFLADVRYETETDLISQELRLSDNEADGFDWTVGLQYWKQEVDQIDAGNNCINVLHFLAPTTGGVPDFAFPPAGLPPIPSTPCGQFIADIGPQGTYESAREEWFRDTEHWSAYFLVQLDLTDRIELDLEGRYVDEEEEVGGPDSDTVIDPIGLGFNADLFGPGAIPGCVAWDGAPGFPFNPFSCVNPRPGVGIVSAESDDSYFIPKATLKYTPGDNRMYYFSIGQAAKPEGIAAVTGGPGAFNPEGNRFKREEKTTYEAGGKITMADGAMTFNYALFYDDYKDKQVSTQIIDPSTNLLVPTTDNASAEVWGLELDTAWQATDNLYLRAAYTRLDSEYTDFVQLTGSAGTIAYGGNCTVVTTSAGDVACGVSFNGNDLEFAPKNSFVGAFRYDLPFDGGGLDWYVEGDGSYTDERFVAANNILALDDYWMFNFRAGVNTEKWEVIAYVDNAFDDDTAKEGLDNIDTRYLSADFTAPAGFSILVPNGARYLLPDPRTYGIRATYRFGN
jgi:outer membrane receptor protein involved in Fe transport